MKRAAHLAFATCIALGACAEDGTTALPSGSNSPTPDAGDNGDATAGPDAAAGADATSQPDATANADALTAPDATDPNTPDAGFAVDAGHADSGTMSTPDSGQPPFPGTLDNWCGGQPADFSFFVTSMNALWTLAGDSVSNLGGGFGGDFGGIAGADHICQTIGNATGSTKTWRAFLSATDDGNGNQVHAIERIGAGPWTDANGRLVASDVAGLSGNRPDGNAASVNDLPDECGTPLSSLGDAHDVVTGSNRNGRLANADMNWTCNDWTSNSSSVGANTGGPGPGGNRNGVMTGHSFPRNSRNGLSWVSDHPLRGCSKGANLTQNGPGVGTCIGCSGGYGAIYCFAL